MQFHVHIQIILNQHYTPAKPIVVNYARKITNSRVLNLNRFMWPYRKSQGALNSVDNFSGIFHSELKWWTDRLTFCQSNSKMDSLKYHSTLWSICGQVDWIIGRSTNHFKWKEIFISSHSSKHYWIQDFAVVVFLPFSCSCLINFQTLTSTTQAWVRILWCIQGWVETSH